MAEKNGEYVMDALRSLDAPATLTTVVKHIADRYQVQPAFIKEPVKQILDKGVEFGFIRREGARYKAEIAENQPGAENNAVNPAAECFHRARRTGGSRRRSRSRSRSRRRRSGSRRRSRSRRRRR